MLKNNFLNYPCFCFPFSHYLVGRDLDLMQISNIVIHYPDDIAIVSETGEWARTDMNAMVTQMTNEVNKSRKDPRACACTNSKILRNTWAGTTQDILQATKNKLLSLPNSRTKQENWCLVGLLGFWRMHISYLRILLASICKTT